MSRKSIILFLCAFLILPVKIAMTAPISEDLNSAVVYAYFKIGEDDASNQALSLDGFRRQIDEIVKNNYNVVPIRDVLLAQKNGDPLPAKTIVLTFENFDRDFLDSVWPILKHHKFPFVLVLNASKLDRATEDGTSPNWSDLEKLKDSQLVEIAMTAYVYKHTNDLKEEDLSLDINRSKVRFREKLNIEPIYFSYPFGEYTPDYISAVSKQGFQAAFTQASGVIGTSTKRDLLPRYTMTEIFSDVDRFLMTSSALPLPIQDVEPDSVFSETNPPLLGFTVGSEIPDSDLKKMICFASGISDVKVQTMSHRVEVRMMSPFDDSKGRINCTIPVPSSDGLSDADTVRWRWVGFQFSFAE